MAAEPDLLFVHLAVLKKEGKKEEKNVGWCIRWQHEGQRKSLSRDSPEPGARRLAFNLTCIVRKSLPFGLRIAVSRVAGKTSAGLSGKKHLPQTRVRSVSLWWKLKYENFFAARPKNTWITAKWIYKEHKRWNLWTWHRKALGTNDCNLFSPSSVKSLLTFLFVTATQWFEVILKWLH